MDKEEKTLKQKALHEFRVFIWISLYLFVFFWMFIVYRSIILREQEIDFYDAWYRAYQRSGARQVHAHWQGLPSRSESRQRAADISHTLEVRHLCNLLALCKIREEAILGYFHGKSFGYSIADLSGGSWRPVFILTIILFVVLIPLTAFGELERVVGEEKLHGLFLGPRDLSKPFGQQAV